ncbi:apolipoprotein Da, duplicate 2 [Chanos chanos]|uniref:Apolipoprotein D n=1 Tax=Chanos chanos TaxID=29144 RepID=A0A6J2VCA3_CHACN|nr:apolipoprotein D-like [Chanos chanos]
MQALHVLSLTLLSVLAVSGQNFHPGRCPTPPVQQNFDATRYVGRWYEIQKLPAIFQKGECGQATYTLRSDGVVQVLNEEWLADGTVNSIEGTAKVKDVSEPAKLEVSFYEGTPPGPYWVLSTDYDNYALVYGCTNYFGLFHVDFAWILARSRSLPAETMDEVHGILTSNGIKIDKLTTTDQSPELCSNMPL